MLIRFLIYGIVGWIIEILWTGFHSFLRKDYSLMGNTSLLMFPIYGLVLALEPAFIFLVGYPLVVRGGVYMLSIFFAEYFSGLLCRQYVGICPWDYSESRYNIHGLIRIDYAPCWFFVGLFYESLYFFVLKNQIIFLIY